MVRRARLFFFLKRATILRRFSETAEDVWKEWAEVALPGAELVDVDATMQDIRLLDS